MSIKAIDWAFHVQTPMLSGTDAFVLVALADNADESGRSYPSVETISRKTKHDRKTVMFALQRLEKHGFIQDTGERMGFTKSVKVYRLRWADERTEAIPKTGQVSYPQNGTGKLSLISGEAIPILPEAIPISPREPSGTVNKEPKRNQLSKFIEFLKKDRRFDGLDVEQEIERAVCWCRKKNRALTERFLESWLLHSDRPLEEDEEEELSGEGTYYSWEGWTEERRRALMELCPLATLPPVRWDKFYPDLKQQIEARVKEGWTC